MSGSEALRVAIKNLTSASALALKESGLTSKDLDWVVAHQANLRIITQVSDRLGFPLDKFILNIEEYGNTSSASIPIALDEGVRDGRIKPGQNVLLCALGAGISWGAAMVCGCRFGARPHGRALAIRTARQQADRVEAPRRGPLADARGSVGLLGA